VHASTLYFIYGQSLYFRFALPRRKSYALFLEKKTCSEEGKYQLLQTQPELFHICLCSAHRPVFLAHQPKRRHTNFQTECKQIRELLFSALSGARASLRTGSSAHGQAHQVTGTGFFKTYFSFIFYKWLHLKNVQI
jgi:hypothetical protein